MSNTFQTGEHYSLSKFFKGDYTKIVIPDLQRDYCWGGKGRLVEEFIKNLIVSGFKKDKAKLPLGLLYGYEEPEGHIQLCDGQQRLTTLFLLIGLLNKRCENKYQQLLISDFELEKDDKEPHLQYAIRENSLYFISDLVCNFFLKSDGDISEIKRESWYFNDYDNDPSIQSMLLALSEIEKTLQSYLDVGSYPSFAEYITGDLTFMYYDMGERSSGEETFVIINTTGEPLSPTENLKPRYVTKYSDPVKMWEEWEQWFWVKRNRKINDTADSGLLEFFRWVILLETRSATTFEETKKQLVKQAEDKRFDFELVLEIQPYVIDRYFKVVQKVFAEVLPNNMAWLSPSGINTQVDWLRILPLIAYCDKYPNASKREIVRVKQFFKNLTQIANVTKDIANLLTPAVDIVWQMSDSDIAKITDANDRLLTAEEKLKFSIFLGSSDRQEIEDIFWDIQSDKGKIWQGEIMPILQWSMIDGKFDFARFKQFNEAFYKIFDGDCSSNIDPVRRALLTRNLKDYPRFFKGYTNYSFGWEYSDWKRLINDNTKEFGLFFEDIIRGVKLGDMIKNFADKSNWWYVFVENWEYMSYCGQKKVQLVGRDIIRLLSQAKASADHKYLYGWQEVCDKNDWAHWATYGSDCIYTDYNKCNVAIDLCVESDNLTEERFFLKLFNREKSIKEHLDLQNIIKKFDLEIDDDGRAKSNMTSSFDCYELCEKIRSEISSLML